MLKSDLTASLRRAAGGAEWISQKELRDYLGWKDPHKSREIVQGCAKLGQRFYVPDVAESLQQRIRRQR
jgi:hypothetical protein